MSAARSALAVVVVLLLGAPLALLAPTSFGAAGAGGPLLPAFVRVNAIDTLLVSIVCGAAASIAGELALRAVPRPRWHLILLAGVLIPAPVLAAGVPDWLRRLRLDQGHAGWLLAALPTALATVLLTGIAARHLRVAPGARAPLSALLAALAVWDASLITAAGAGPVAVPSASLLLEMLRGVVPAGSMEALTLLAATPAVLTAVVVAVVVTRTVIPPER